MSVNFTGHWLADLSKSRFLGPLPKAVSVKIEHSGPEIQEIIEITNPDGSEERVTFKGWTNGEQDKNLLNGIAVSGYARWYEEELIIESRMRFAGREMHFCDCWSLSSDGQTLFMEHRNDDLAGQLTILNRVG